MSGAEGGGAEGPGLKLSRSDRYYCTQHCSALPPGVVRALQAGGCELAWGFVRGFCCSCRELGLSATEAWGTGSWSSVTYASTSCWILWVRGHCTENNRKEMKWIPGYQKSISKFSICFMTCNSCLQMQYVPVIVYLWERYHNLQFH